MYVQYTICILHIYSYICMFYINKLILKEAEKRTKAIKNIARIFPKISGVTPFDFSNTFLLSDINKKNYLYAVIFM